MAVGQPPSQHPNKENIPPPSAPPVGTRSTPCRPSKKSGGDRMPLEDITNLFHRHPVSALPAVLYVSEFGVVFLELEAPADAGLGMLKRKRNVVRKKEKEVSTAMDGVANRVCLRKEFR